MTDLYALVEQSVAGLGVEIVDVERAAQGLLRVTIDRADGVRIEDCEAVSRQLTRVFEVENIDFARMEVGSPGTDRPLRREADFVRFADERIEIKLREAMAGRKVFGGTLRVSQEPETKTEAGQVVPATTVFGLEFEEKKGEIQVLHFTLDEIERAKLDPVLDFKGKKR